MFPGKRHPKPLLPPFADLSDNDPWVVIKDDSFTSVPVATDRTVFERCVEAVTGTRVDVFEKHPYALSRAGAETITTAVLTALAEHTGSPRTVDEVMRVLGEAG